MNPVWLPRNISPAPKKEGIEMTGIAKEKGETI